MVFKFYQFHLRGTVALNHIDLHARVAELHRAVSEESGITLIEKSITSCVRTHRGVSSCRAAKRISKATGIILDLWREFRARDDSFEGCMVMLVANIGGLGKLGKF